MRTFNQLIEDFSKVFTQNHFPNTPLTLYDPCKYFLTIGGKRIRPILCLLANELFGSFNEDAYSTSIAIELFHNFTLIHDDIMDAASLRRGMQTIHTKFGNSVALLSGDVMLIRAYEYLTKINPLHLVEILPLFNTTAKEVCEGQQLDMDFEQQTEVLLEDYIQMIGLKTSVLLAASLEMGAILANASPENRKHIYSFGYNLGIAFQIQDDYLDAFGDPIKFGKEVGGDIKQNKKTFLLIHALEVAMPEAKNKLLAIINTNPPDKVNQVMEIYQQCKVGDWANELKSKYIEIAFTHLNSIDVPEENKQPIISLANFLIQREH